MNIERWNNGKVVKVRVGSDEVNKEGIYGSVNKRTHIHVYIKEGEKMGKRQNGRN